MEMENVTMTKAEFEEVKRIRTEHEAMMKEKTQKEMDAIEKDKQQKLVDAIVARVAPVKNEVKFVASEPEKKESGVQYCKSFAEFLYMVKTADPRLKTAMSTTSAQGGYTIPELWATEIANRMNNFAQVPQLCRTVPMTSSTLHVNEFLTDLSVAWATEATDKNQTKPTFSQDDLTLKFLYAIITATRELKLNSLLSLDSFLKDLVAQNMALEIEQEILEGTTFTGVSSATGVNVNIAGGGMLGANLDYADFTATVNNTGVLESYKTNSKWFLNRSALNLAMTLVDANRRPLWNINNAFAKPEMTILGYPYIISDQIAGAGTAASQTSIYFGDPQTIWIGKHVSVPDIEVLWTNTAIISSSTSVSENLFQANKEAWRFETYKGILVAVPAAWVKIGKVQ